MATFSKLFAGAAAFALSHVLAAAQPFYARGDLAAEPALIGTFAAPRPALETEPSSIREGVVIRGEGSAYRLAFRDGTQWGGAAAAEYLGRLFRLGVDEDDRPCYFLDLTPLPGPGRRAPGGASHLALAARWDYDGAELRLGTVDREWLARQLASGLLPHRKAAESEIVLTASTSQLRRVLLLAAAQGAVDWSDPLYRQPEPVSARPTP